MRIPDHLPWKSAGKTLGSGGQGVVEVVTREDDPGGPQFALKALKRVQSSQARQRFRSEIEAVKSLDHDAIVPVIDQSEPDDPFQFYVMEYIPDAKPLNRVIFDGPNPYHGNATKCLDLFQKIVDAIQACEQVNPQVVHRDIKPGNILILPDETIRLIDFGICQIQDGAMITLTDENVGARNYTSPECEAGYEGSVGIQSDLYSAGKVLWSAITSRPAFAREAPAFSNLSMRTLFPERPETWHLTHVYEKTIRENPSDRSQSAKGLVGFITELRAVMKGGFPPLEEMRERCPSCGWKRLESRFDLTFQIFGNLNSRASAGYRCSFCGFAFLRDSNVLRASLSRITDIN